MITMPFPHGIYRIMRLYEVMDALKLGWMPLDTLKGTPHEKYSVQCVWLCRCRMVVPVE